MEQRTNDQKLGSGLAHYQDFVKGKGLEPQVKKVLQIRQNLETR